MIKSSYKNRPAEKQRAISNNLPIPSNDDERAAEGAAGINLLEMAQEAMGQDPEKYKDNHKMKPKDNSVKENVFDLLVELGDVSDKEGNLLHADFADFLIGKFAEAETQNPAFYFNQLMIKIAKADLPDTNDLIKKLTKIYNRTIILEYQKSQDITAAKKSAYNKILHRANQYLSDGSMIGPKSAQYLVQNPQYVATQIKSIIDIMISTMSQDARNRAYPNLLSKIQALNTQELASKSLPGGASIGVSISLIKNILNGKNPGFINQTIDELAKILF